LPFGNPLTFHFLHGLFLLLPVTLQSFQMHTFRVDKRRNDKMKAMLSGLNLGGNVQMFNGMNFGGGGGGDLASLLGGGGGGMGGQNSMSEAQMRKMARAMADGTATDNNGGGGSSGGGGGRNADGETIFDGGAKGAEDEGEEDFDDDDGVTVN
jgi:hypothetical protein